MTTTSYRWQTGGYGNFKRIDPNVVGSVLSHLEESGPISPRRVVTAATPDDSPLHPMFDWDDRHAADRWRLEQASQVLGAIAVVYRDPRNNTPLVTRAFVAIEEQKGMAAAPIWMSTARAMSDGRLRSALIAQALRDVQLLERRYQELSELAEIFEQAETRLRSLLQPMEAQP